MQYTRFLALAIAVLLLSTAAGGEEAARGVVVAPERLAAKVGAQVMREGGNAADAAVAVHFALAVTFPVAGNLGGGGFLLLAKPGAAGAVAEVFALDYRETAPAAAHRDLFLDDEGDVVDGLSLSSHLAAGVPGSVMGMWELHRRFGSRPWAELLAPAVGLAEEGFALDAPTAKSFADFTARAGELPDRYRSIRNFASYFHGSAGDTLVQKELAATLRRIAEAGADGFYKGETAAMLVAEMKRGEGVMTTEDLAAYRAVWRDPLAGSYRGHRVVSMPPPSSGGVALLQLLGMLEGFPPPARQSVQHLHLFAEVEKRVFADRALYLGDPDFAEVPVAGLTDRAYCRARAQGISLDKRSDPAAITAGKPAVAAAPESEETTHYSIVDGRGVAVSSTTTLNAGFGSGLVVGEAGFLLNNEMDDFAAKPGARNLYGVTGAAANAVAPGKRMLSSMTPTFVFKPTGELWLVLGTPGGPTIFTTVLQVITNRIDHGMALAEAVAAPRFHHQWPPASAAADPISHDGDLPAATIAGLVDLGYTLARRSGIGDVQAIELDGTQVTGASDPRGRGAVERE